MTFSLNKNIFKKRRVRTWLVP